jgi:hypothetical protein
MVSGGRVLYLPSFVSHSAAFGKELVLENDN